MLYVKYWCACRLKDVPNIVQLDVPECSILHSYFLHSPLLSAPFFFLVYNILTHDLSFYSRDIGVLFADVYPYAVSLIFEVDKNRQDFDEVNTALTIVMDYVKIKKAMNM